MSPRREATRRTMLKQAVVAGAAGVTATWQVPATIAGDGDAGAIAEPEHARYDGLGTLYRQPAKGMYSDDEIANMADKHHHMNALASQAAWAWGINICNTPRKFEAICRAR